MNRERWLPWLLGGAVVLVIGLTSLAGWAYWTLAVPLRGRADSTNVTVPIGQSVAMIAHSLEQQGVIRSAMAVRGYLRLTRQSIQAGSYTLTKEASSLENIEPLLRGAVAEQSITLPEGLRIAEIARRLAAAGIVSADALLAAAVYDPTHQSLPVSTTLKTGTLLEGFLFPDTYRFHRSTPALAVVDRLLETYRERTAALKPTYDQLILASIVEREAKFDEDRSLIAGVYTNRLRLGMALQADPTVQYAQANALCTEAFDRCHLEDWWSPPAPADLLSLDSPYNTYRVTGLPPGPISNPGLASIEAAVHPAVHQFFYFVTDAEGHAHFAQTLAEHNANVARYLTR